MKRLYKWLRAAIRRYWLSAGEKRRKTGVKIPNGMDCKGCGFTHYNKKARMHECDLYGQKLHGGKNPVKCMSCIRDFMEVQG